MPPVQTEGRRSWKTHRRGEVGPAGGVGRRRQVAAVRPSASLPTGAEGRSFTFVFSVRRVILVGQEPGTEFNEGPNIVRYKVYDQAGNRAACKFIVRIEGALVMGPEAALPVLSALSSLKGGALFPRILTLTPVPNP